MKSTNQPCSIGDMTLLNRILLILLMGTDAAIGAEIRDARKTEQGFSIPKPNPQYSFPENHGSHPDYRIEWWYLTGHLFAGTRRFGFQATFFRMAERPGPAPEGAFSDGQYYLAHMALSDPAGDRFLHEERLNREGWDAFSRSGDLDLRNGDWTLSRSDDNQLILTGSILSDARFALTLSPEKEHVIFGEDGISRKGPKPGESSHYITFPRLAVSGSLRLDGEDLDVTGQAWMDHEISSSQLSRDQVGWDWVSMQFEDGREIMAFILRKSDGTADAFSTLAWVGPDGRVTHFSADRFSWEAKGLWQSPETGARYPNRVRIAAPEPGSEETRIFRIQPTMDHQEIAGDLGGIAYWEGACDVLDDDGKVIGRAFLELTGYAEDELEQRLQSGNRQGGN